MKPSSLNPFAAAACTALLAAPAHAVENGVPITPPGIFDFGSGILPPPSDVGAAGIRLVFLRASTLKDGSGNTGTVKPSMKINAVVLAGLKMTDRELFGGKYGFGVVVPTVDGSLGLTIPTPAGSIRKDGSNRAVGDVQIAPVIIQWKPQPNLFTNASVVIQLPTGSYDSRRTFNAGVNHWTIQPNFALTYITASGLEFSASSQLNFNLKNHETQYRSGIEWQQDFGIGQHVGEWIFGVGGYHYRQLTNDKAPGLADGHRSRVTALGPAIGFVAPRRGLPLVFAHVYREFGARNRTQGTQVALRASWAF